MTLIACGILFVVFFSAAYHVWWPAVFVAVAPLAILQGISKSHPWRAFAIVTFFGSTAWLIVYHFFGTYSIAGLVVLAVVNGINVSTVMGISGWIQRRTGLPYTFILPVAWTAGEYMRMSGPIGMPVGLLAPVCREQLWMIQVADLAGIYGLSFAIAMVNGLIADVVLRWQRGQAFAALATLLRPLVTTAGLWAFIGAYGALRLVEARETMREGPDLCIVQPDVPTSDKTGLGFDPDLHLEEMLGLSDRALGGGPKPDLVVWPEAMRATPPLNREFLALEQTYSASETGALNRHRPGSQAAMALSHDHLLQQWTDQNQVPLLLGTEARIPRLETEDPGAGMAGSFERFNAAIHYSPFPDSCIRKPQYKMRLFPWGEFRPWRNTAFFQHLASLPLPGMDNRRESWFTAGTERHVYECTSQAPSAGRAEARYIVSICSEIMFPDSSGILERSDEGAKPFDFIVNISNDGAFQRNRALLIHNYLIPFRAVEARVGIARSSNTGISCFVKPTGEIHGVITNERDEAWTGKGAPELALITDLLAWRARHEQAFAFNPALLAELQARIAQIADIRSEAGVSGTRSETVYIDSRQTLYSRKGDLFPRGLAFLSIIALIVLLARRERKIEILCSKS